MSMLKAEDYVICRGEKFQIEFYFDREKAVPAKEYLEKSSLAVKVKLMALAKYMADAGKIYDITKYRLVDPKEKIYEFKPLQHRFFNFFHKRGKIIITNAYMKQSQKVDRKELQKAIMMKKDYIHRNEGGIYYGKENS